MSAFASVGAGQNTTGGRDVALGLKSGVQNYWTKSSDNSMFTPQTWTRTRGYHQEWRDFTPSNVISDGGTINWKVNKAGDLLDTMEIILQYTVVAGGATVLRPPPEGGHGMLQQLQINYNTNNIKQHDGDYLNARFELETNEWDRDGKSELLLIDKTIAERDAIAATGTVVFVIKAGAHWEDYTHKHLNMSALPHNLNVDATLRQAIQVWQWNNTGVPVITLASAFLRCWFTHVERVERAGLVKMTLKEGGVLQKIIDNEEVRNVTIASGVTTTRIPLSNIKNPATHLIFTIRPTAGLVTTFSPTKQRNNFQTCSSFTLQENGRDLLPTITHRYGLFHLNTKYFNGRKGVPIYMLPLCAVPSDKLHGLGDLNFSQMNNPELVINWAAPDFGAGVPAESRVDVYAEVHNLLHMEKGDLIKKFR
jgi:hypothetical protein